MVSERTIRLSLLNRDFRRSSMDIRIEPILIEQKSVFIQMMELYNYDFSEYSDDDINEYGILWLFAY